MNASPYDHPRLYDIAYGWRDFRAECTFMIAQYKAMRGLNPVSALEVACGPGNHARMLAAMGIQSVGLDMSEPMLAYARRAPGGDDPDVRWRLGDMRDFDLDQPADLGYCLMDSLSHLLSLDEMLMHLNAVARNLPENGVYILDQSHPRDIFDADEPGTPAEWESEDEDGDVTVRTTWGAEADEFDSTTQVGHLSVTLTAYRDARMIQELKSTVLSRLWLPGEMEAAIRLSGEWRIAARYGALDDSVRWQHAPPASRMVTVLQRV